MLLDEIIILFLAHCSRSHLLQLLSRDFSECESVMTVSESPHLPFHSKHRMVTNGCVCKDDSSLSGWLRACASLAFKSIDRSCFNTRYNNQAEQQILNCLETIGFSSLVILKYWAGEVLGNLGWTNARQQGCGGIAPATSEIWRQCACLHPTDDHNWWLDIISWRKLKAIKSLIKISAPCLQMEIITRKFISQGKSRYLLESFVDTSHTKMFNNVAFIREG